MDEPSDPRKNRYIQQLLGKNYCKLFTDTRGTLKLKDYKHILKLDWRNKETWRFQIQWYQKWQDDHFHLIYDYKYSEFEVPDDFERTAKAGPSRVIVGSDEIRYKNYRETETTNWGAYENDLHVTADLVKGKIDDLKSKNLVIWSTRSDEDALRCTFRLLQNFGSMAGVKIISVAKRDAEVMELLEEQNANIVSLNNWYLSENEILECFVFFSKFRNLVHQWTLKSIFEKPSEIPYQQFANCSNYDARLPKEFKDHLVKIFDLQGKKLKLDKFPALRSWYKDETIVYNTFERLDLLYYESQLIIAIRMFPNRPVAKEHRKLKSLLLINNL